MMFRSPSRRLKHTAWLACAAGLLCLATPGAVAAREPLPVLSIPLSQVGFEPQVPQYLVAGSSLVTLHFVDSTHLLLTYASHALLKRLPDDPPDDRDHVISALLLELPSGKVLARTQWRLHDHSRYLWGLGHGQFLLRIRNSLSLFAPVTGLASGDAFALRSFLHTTRTIEAVELSPAADLLTLETSAPAVPFPVAGPPPQHPDDSGILINFYRLLPPAEDMPWVHAAVAGSVQSHHLLNLPVTSTGYVHALDQGHSRWAFDFNSYAGRKLELNLFDSTCRPVPLFVSEAEFIAFGCRGDSSIAMFGAFNLLAESTWRASIDPAFVSPVLVTVPAAGRFALSRTLVVGAAVNTASLSPAEVTSQTIDVYQTASGANLLHITADPIIRAGQNFDLSPDGLQFAVLRNQAIEVYPLPSLSDADRKAIARLTAALPPPTLLPVSFVEPASAAPQPPEAPPAPHVAAVQPTSKPPAQPPAPPPPAAGQHGDPSAVPTHAPPPAGVPDPALPADEATPAEPRKPPSLLAPDPTPH
ncbi:MAG: hypothetical protein KGK08_03660 [Acidobacteriota bacterium]|nr:hypothetical protein [Acidobacteriota bacterium]